MQLNEFGNLLIAALTRIAEGVEAAAGKTQSPAATSSAPAGETAAAKKKREAAEKAAADAAAAAANSPKADRAAVNKALVTLKDTVSKDAAQAVYKAFGYEAMSKIEEKDFDKVLAAATKELEDFANKTGNYEVKDAPLDDGDDDL